MWYNGKGKDSDVVLSTRVRLARNIAGYPFPGKMTDQMKKEVADKVAAAFTGEDWESVSFDKITPAERASMLEKHLVSREFVSAVGERSLVKNDEKTVYIMTPEEDHLRIQSIVSGFDTDSAMSAAYEAEEISERTLEFAYSEKYGYITHCPTNLGTGMRVSVMLHLPAYTAVGGIRELSLQLARIGMTVRGMDGEGSRAAASIYQISNQTTLGISEEDTAKKINDVVAQIIKNERELRERLSEGEREDLAERVRRDYGILMYTQSLTAAELVSMYSDMRYAAAMGLMNTPTDVLDEMLVRSLPNTVAIESGAETPRERDRARAESVRAILAHGE